MDNNFNMNQYSFDSSYAKSQLTLNRYIARTYAWMFLGLMVTFLVRDKLSNAALLTLGGMLFVKLWEYFFAYGIWGYDPTGQIFWTRILPTVLYSTLWTPLWYWLFGRLSEYFARRLEVR